MYTKYYISLALFVCPNMKPQSWRTNLDELDLSRSLVTDTRGPIYKISYDNLTIILRQCQVTIDLADAGYRIKNFHMQDILTLRCYHIFFTF